MRILPTLVPINVHCHPKFCIQHKSRWNFMSQYTLPKAERLPIRLHSLTSIIVNCISCEYRQSRKKWKETAIWFPWCTSETGANHTHRNKCHNYFDTDRWVKNVFINNWIKWKTKIKTINAMIWRFPATSILPILQCKFDFYILSMSFYDR